jgi:hypothetical protein
MQNMNRNTIITGVIALIVGVLIGWFIGQSSGTPKTAMTGEKMVANIDSAMSDDKSKDGAMMEGDSMKTVDADAAVLVSDQAAGNTVTVASVETSESTWVAIREGVNGGMGNILGASRIDAGASNNIVVDLLRPTMAGNDYYVVLFNDNGDRMFDHKIDMPLSSDGVIITQTFKALAQ